MGYTPAQLDVRPITGGYSAYPFTVTTGDDLKVLANGIDAYPYILLYGNSGIVLMVKTAQAFKISDSGAGDLLSIAYATPDIIITALANKNIWLKPSGTGKIKVAGTATGTGDVAINGYYEILDEAGATIKLARVA